MLAVSASGELIYHPAAAASDVRISKSVVAHHRVNPFRTLIPAPAATVFDFGDTVAIVAMQVAGPARQGTGILPTILLNRRTIAPLVPAPVAAMVVAIAVTRVQQDIEKIVKNPIKAGLRRVKSFGRSGRRGNSNNHCENQCGDNFFHRGLH